MLTHLGALAAASSADLRPELLRECRRRRVAGYFLLPRLRPHERLAHAVPGGGRHHLAGHELGSGGTLGRRLGTSSPDRRLPSQRGRGANSAARMRTGCGPLAVVKRGAKGALAVKGGESWKLNPSESPYRPVKIVDTTGAGGNFDTGFLRAWLGREAVRAWLHLGQRCAVSSLAFPGGIAGQICDPGHRGSIREIEVESR